METKLKILKEIKFKNKEDDIAIKYKVSKGTVYTNKKNMNKWSRTAIVNHKNENIDLTHTFYDVFIELRKCDIPVNGPILKMLVLKIANCLNFNTFKSSNEWIEKFKKEI